MLIEWPTIGEIAAHSAYVVFSRYKYLIVNLVFVSNFGFWRGNLFLIAPFPDHCLLVPFYFTCDANNVCIALVFIIIIVIFVIIIIIINVVVVIFIVTII